MANETPDQQESRDASVDKDDRKVFVGSIPQQISDERLLEQYFGWFGKVESIDLKTNATTGRSRGFAFVVFKDKAAAEWAIDLGEDHFCHGKNIVVKRVQPKPGKITECKLQRDVTEKELREFSGYGTIAEVEGPFGKVKNKKNSCHIIFKKEKPAKRLLMEGTVTIKEGLDVNHKKVTPTLDVGWMGCGSGCDGGCDGVNVGGGGHSSSSGPGRTRGCSGWARGFGDHEWNTYKRYRANPCYGGGWRGYGAGGGGSVEHDYAGGKIPRGPFKRNKADPT